MRGRDPRALGSDQHLPGRLQTKADRSPRQPILAVAALASWSDVTRGELAERVRLVAAGLIARGIGAGDRVAVMGGTRLEWTIAELDILDRPFSGNERELTPTLQASPERERRALRSRDRIHLCPRKGSVNAHGRR